MKVTPSSPYQTMPYMTEKPSAAISQEFAPLKDRKLPECFERLVKEVLTTIAEQEKQAVITWSHVLNAEQGWRDMLLQEQMALDKSTSSWQSWDGLLKKCAQIILPVSLVVEGAAICVFTGGATIPVMAAMAIGGVLTLDGLIDDGGKRAISSLLSKATDEDSETWLRRISIVTSVVLCATSLGLGFSAVLPHGVKIAATASGVGLTCTRGATEWGLNKKKAELETLGFSWEESTRRFSDLLTNTRKQTEAANFVFEKNVEFQRATMGTSRFILS